MAGIKGKKWSNVIKLDDVAMSVDDLTEQMLLANKLRAAEILHQQEAMATDDYQKFLWQVFKW